MLYGHQFAANSIPITLTFSVSLPFNALRPKASRKYLSEIHGHASERRFLHQSFGVPSVIAFSFIPQCLPSSLQSATRQVSLSDSSSGLGLSYFPYGLLVLFTLRDVAKHLFSVSQTFHTLKFSQTHYNTQETGWPSTRKQSTSDSVLAPLKYPFVSHISIFPTISHGCILDKPTSSFFVVSHFIKS